MTQEEANAILNEWAKAHRTKALLEGWCVFIRIPSSNDNDLFMFQRIDGTVRLGSDWRSWQVLFKGREAHHLAAQGLMRLHSPRRWQQWCSVVPNWDGFDVSTLPEAMQVEIVAAVLGK